MDRSTANGRLAALNFLMPYVQRLPNRLLRSEWATRIASELRVDEPVFREALRRAAVERRSGVKLKPELLAPIVKPAERRLIQMLVEAHDFREKLAMEVVAGSLHRGLETEKIIELLVAKAAEPLNTAEVASLLEESDRRVLFEVLFDQTAGHSWEEAEACLDFLRNRQIAQELSELEKQVQSQPSRDELLRLLARKDELRRILHHKQHANVAR
jgi:DNA primase